MRQPEARWHGQNSTPESECRARRTRRVRRGVVTPARDEPTAQAQGIMERVRALVRECRVVLRSLEHSPKPDECPRAEAERA